ncbi:hypothetical protein BD309DRAFT_969589 [Dichomitus squalens]|nr:hypothetical protein BD309DRAFT_969589 [Dichomitus squalens]
MMIRCAMILVHSHAPSISRSPFCCRACMYAIILHDGHKASNGHLRWLQLKLNFVFLLELSLNGHFDIAGTCVVVSSSWASAVSSVTFQYAHGI